MNEDNLKFIKIYRPIKLFEGLEYKYDCMNLVDENKLIDDLKRCDDEDRERDLLSELSLNVYGYDHIKRIIIDTRSFLNKTETFE